MTRSIYVPSVDEGEKKKKRNSWSVLQWEHPEDPQVANQADKQAGRNIFHYFYLLSSPRPQLLFFFSYQSCAQEI